MVWYSGSVTLLWNLLRVLLMLFVSEQLPENLNSGPAFTDHDPSEDSIHVENIAFKSPKC